MKRILFFAAAIGFATSRIGAQQADNPVSVPVTYWAQAVTLGSPMPPTSSFSFGAELGYTNSASAPSTPGGAVFTSAMSPTTSNVTPGKEYSVQVTSVNVAYVRVFFQAQPGTIVTLDGVRSESLNKGYSYSFKFRLDLVGDSSQGLDGRAGESSEIVADKPIWHLGLGKMRDGASAGAIGFRYADFSSANIFKPDGLIYQSRNTSEVDVIRSSGVLRQVYAREVLVDIQPNTATKYTVKVVPRALVSGPSGGLYTFTDGTQVITYTVEQRTVYGGSGITITRMEDSETWETSLELVGSASTGTWTRRNWRRTTAPTSSKVTTNNASSPVVVTQSGRKFDDSGDEDALVWHKTFTTHTWGKEVDKFTFGPAETIKVETQYKYYTTTGSDGSLARALKWIRNPNGSWAKYDYFGTSVATGARGMTKRVYRPWEDLQGNPESASTANSTYEDWTYTANFDTVATLPSSRKVYTPGGTLVAESSWTHTPDFATYNSYSVWKAAQKDFWGSGGSDYLTTTSYYYPENCSSTYLRGKPLSIEYPDGRKIAYTYFNGTWTASGRSFSASAGGTDRLILVFHGQGTAGTQSPAAVSVSSWGKDGQTWSFPSLYLAPTRSTVSEIVVDNTGRTVFTAENVYTTSGTLERISGSLFDYDSHGRLKKEVDIARSVGGNEFKTLRNFSGGLLVTITATDGVVTKYDYDDLLRVTKVTNNWNPAGDHTPFGTPYPTTVEERRYDGANRVVRVFAKDTTTQPVKTEYDGAGRRKKQSVPKPDGSGTNWLETVYAYDAVTTIKTTMPTEAYRVDETYFDGRPKSVTGTAVPPQSFDYDYNSTGLRTLRRNGATQENGWLEEQYDRLGRLDYAITPAWTWTSGSTKTVKKDYTYSSTRGLRTSVRTSYYDGSTTTYPIADTVYEYDPAGRLLREGLDVNANGALDVSLSDRIQVYDTVFGQDAWGWYQDKTAHLYATAGSSAATEVSRVRTRFTGFNNSQMSGESFAVNDVVTWDSSGWRSVHWTWVNPTTAERSNTQQFNGSSTIGYESYFRGYLDETKSTSSAFAGYEYDAYGRLQTQRGRWNGSGYDATTTYAYYGPTSIASSVTAGGITTNYAYSWDTVAHTSKVTVTDAAGKTTHTLSNAMGLPKRIWGSAAQPSEYDYDIVGRRTTMTTWRASAISGDFASNTWPSNPGAGAVTTWVYDNPSGLLKEKRYADHVEGTTNRKWTYAYTPLGQTRTRTWARNTVTTYNYSEGLTGTGDLTSVDYSDTTADVVYSYVRSGAPYQVTDATGTRTFSYRSDLQLDYEQLDGTFYGSGRKVWGTYEDGSGGTVYGRLNGHKFGTDSVEENASRFTFDATTGRVAYVRGKFGTNGFNFGYTTGTNWVQTVTGEVANTYLRTNLLVANRSVLDSVETKWGTTVKGTYDTSFNSVGLRSTVAQSGSVTTAGTFTYGYDDRWELTGADFSVGTAKDYTWGYDLMGKRTAAVNDGSSTTYTASSDATKDVNQYASITGESGLAYDADGNLTSDGTWDYAYDAENRLIRMDRKNLLQHLYFTYDYLGRRAKKTERNYAFSVTACTKYAWSGWQLSAELDGGTSETGTTLTKTYLWGTDLSGGAGAGGLLAVTQGGATYYPVYDVQGNVTGYLNASSSGAVTATYEYNPYGQIIASGGSATSFTFGFATQYTDRETGLIYYGRRFYDPKHGRFLNRDPIEEQGGLNLYGFVGNNPANRWDSLGALPTGDPDDPSYKYMLSCMYRAMDDSYGRAQAWQQEAYSRSASNLMRALADGTIQYGPPVDLFEDPRNVSINGHDYTFNDDGTVTRHTAQGDVTFTLNADGSIDAGYVDSSGTYVVMADVDGYGGFPTNGAANSRVGQTTTANAASTAYPYHQESDWTCVIASARNYLEKRGISGVPTETELLNKVAGRLGVTAAHIQQNGLSRSQVEAGLLPELEALGAPSRISGYDPTRTAEYSQRIFEKHLGRSDAIIAVVAQSAIGGNISTHALTMFGTSPVSFIDPAASPATINTFPSVNDAFQRFAHPAESPMYDRYLIVPKP